MSGAAPPFAAAGFSRAARTLGVASALLVAALEAAYVAVLAAGLATLPGPDSPIADPWFTAMEVLILAIMPPMLGLVAALAAWSPPPRRVFAHLALAFMAMTAALTSAVHFAILTLSRDPAFAGLDRVFAFAWPSVVYALDILAWDVFFALAALAAAAAVPGGGLCAVARRLLWVSSALSAAGLAGVAAGDMQLRNVGILGYAVVFPLAALALAGVFARTPPTDPPA